jgi:DNA-binding transcriptional regulator of glucitol operon
MQALLRPRWLAWHVLIVLATAGMMCLGDWQLHRALSGNTLSWAYTFEWPLFAIFAVYFWVKSLRDELAVARATVTPDDPGNGETADSVALRAEDYVAHLKAEVQGHGRWHGWR